MEWFKPAWEALSEEEQFILTEFFVNDVSKTEAVANIGEKLFLERGTAFFCFDFQGLEAYRFFDVIPGTSEREIARNLRAQR